MPKHQKKKLEDDTSKHPIDKKSKSVRADAPSRAPALVALDAFIRMSTWAQNHMSRMQSHLRNPSQSLIEAAKQRQSIWVDFALNNNDIDVLQKDENGNTALHYCAFHGDVVNLKRLLALGAKLCVKNKNGHYPAHMTAKGQSHECFDLLIPDDERKWEKNDLFMAKLWRQGNKMQVLLNVATGSKNSSFWAECSLLSGADVNFNWKQNSWNTINTTGYLHNAIENKNAKTVACLVRHGANLEAVDPSCEKTPLFQALSQLSENEDSPDAVKSIVAIVNTLIEAGANVKAESIWNGSSLTYVGFAAILHESYDIARQLLDRGACPNDMDWQGAYNALHAVARSTKHIQPIDSSLYANPQTNPEYLSHVANYNQKKRVIDAGNEQICKMYQLLLDHGGDATTKDCSGAKPSEIIIDPKTQKEFIRIERDQSFRKLQVVSDYFVSQGSESREALLHIATFLPSFNGVTRHNLNSAFQKYRDTKNEIILSRRISSSGDMALDK
tara:strand:- start:36430 stop:37929 length:1500 start_codon:yes stop_codon:yes gene_type:complete